MCAPGTRSKADENDAIMLELTWHCTAAALSWQALTRGALRGGDGNLKPLVSTKDKIKQPIIRAWGCA